MKPQLQLEISHAPDAHVPPVVLGRFVQSAGVAVQELLHAVSLHKSVSQPLHPLLSQLPQPELQLGGAVSQPSVMVTLQFDQLDSQPWHCPLEQESAWRSAHRSPQPPQWLASVCVLTQSPLQQLSEQFAGHVLTQPSGTEVVRHVEGQLGVQQVLPVHTVEQFALHVPPQPSETGVIRHAGQLGVQQVSPTHWPEQFVLHVPPHPSSPHCLPVHSGVQVTAHSPRFVLQTRLASHVPHVPLHPS